MHRLTAGILSLQLIMREEISKVNLIKHFKLLANYLVGSGTKSTLSSSRS